MRTGYDHVEILYCINNRFSLQRAGLFGSPEINREGDNRVSPFAKQLSALFQLVTQGWGVAWMVVSCGKAGMFGFRLMTIVDCMTATGGERWPCAATVPTYYLPR